MALSFTWVLSSGSFEGGLVVGRSQSWGAITILSGVLAFTLEKIFFWPKLKGSCVEMKKHQPPTYIPPTMAAWW